MKLPIASPIPTVICVAAVSSIVAPASVPAVIAVVIRSIPCVVLSSPSIIPCTSVSTIHRGVIHALLHLLVELIEGVAGNPVLLLSVLFGRLQRGREIIPTPSIATSIAAAVVGPIPTPSIRASRACIPILSIGERVAHIVSIIRRVAVAPSVISVVSGSIGVASISAHCSPVRAVLAISGITDIPSVPTIRSIAAIPVHSGRVVWTTIVVTGAIGVVVVGIQPNRFLVAGLGYVVVSDRDGVGVGDVGVGLRGHIRVVGAVGLTTAPIVRAALAAGIGDGECCRASVRRGGGRDARSRFSTLPVPSAPRAALRTAQANVALWPDTAVPARRRARLSSARLWLRTETQWMVRGGVRRLRRRALMVGKVWRRHVLEVGGARVLGVCRV